MDEDTFTLTIEMPVYEFPASELLPDSFEPWRLSGLEWGIQPQDVPQWWDGHTEVPEGYLWPWQVAEAQADFQFTEESLNEMMATFQAEVVPLLE